MGQAASEPNGLSSVRVLFLDAENATAHELTQAALAAHPQVTTVLATEATVKEEINRADVIVTVDAPVTKGVIARAACLKLICQFGHDVSGIDLKAAEAAGVAVTRVPSKDAGIAESCTEFALYLALDMLRSVDRRPVPRNSPGLGRTLCGLTAMVFGNGGIGQRLALLLQAMGSDASCVDPANRDYEEDLPHADILFFCCKLDDGTRGMVNLDFLRKTKDGVLIVNIAKSQLINMDDLLDVLRLKTNRIGGVALDHNHKALQHEVLSDPLVHTADHVGGATEVSYNCISQLVAENILYALRGEPLVDVVSQAPAVQEVSEGHKANSTTVTQNN